MTTDLEKLPPRLSRWAKEISAASQLTGVCPFLIAAVMDRESLGGEALTPRSPSGTGDNGHGRGLMQIDDKAHPGFVRANFDGAEPLWMLPAFNVLYGAALLAKNLKAFDGHLGAALAAYNAGRGAVRRVLASLGQSPTPEDRLAALDGITTGKNYVSDVMRRRSEFLQAST